MRKQINLTSSEHRKDTIYNLLNPQQNRAARKSALSSEEHKPLKKKIKYTISQSFALDDGIVKGAMALTASDGRESYRSKSVQPYNDTTRRSKEHNRGNMFRKAKT